MRTIFEEKYKEERSFFPWKRKNHTQKTLLQREQREISTLENQNHNVDQRDKGK